MYHKPEKTRLAFFNGNVAQVSNGYGGNGSKVAPVVPLPTRYSERGREPEEPMAINSSAPLRNNAIVLFGASGDLAKKMTFISLYRLAERGLLDMPIIGVAFSDWDDETFCSHARASIEASTTTIDERVFSAMSRNMHFVQGDYSKPETYERVKVALGESDFPLFYLEIPPSLFETTVQGLYNAGLTKNARVIVEKPFGHDAASARALYTALSKMLSNEQLYRIDHYLGKDAVQDIMVWRFANRLFEPLWNSVNIECVQITKSESFDVADRGSFYDRVGALKDVVQNHIMQIIGLLAMDPPSVATPMSIHAQQLEVFRSMRSVDAAHAIRGQYEGYLDVEGVAKDSKTETFIALQLQIDTWRWAGVPFYIRTGKALANTATEAVIVFKRPPLQLFAESGCPRPERNHLRFRLGSNDGVQMRVQALDPSSKMASASVDLDVDFANALGREKLPYEQLLGDALEGDPTRFATQSIIEETWRVLEPLLDAPGPVHQHARGTMGPAEADLLGRAHGGWVAPIPD